MCGPAQLFAEEFFYAWQYERPASPWLFALSALLVVVVMALCLFPLAPHWCQQASYLHAASEPRASKLTPIVRIASDILAGNFTWEKHHLPSCLLLHNVLGNAHARMRNRVMPCDGWDCARIA